METTDPAKEIATLIRTLLASNAKAEAATHEVIRTVAAVGEDELVELCSVVIQRLKNLREFAKKLEDPELDQEFRQTIISGLDSTLAAFRAGSLPGQWQHTKAAFLKRETATALMGFSLMARRYQPLRVVSDDDRNMLVARIDEIAEGLSSDIDVPAWAKAPLHDGLRRLRLTLQHLAFFGHERAIEEIVALHGKAATIAEEIERSTPTSKKPKSIGQILNAVMFAANIFWAPDQVTTAFERYQGWYLKALVHIAPSITKEHRPLLPPPDHSIDPSVIEPRPPKTDPPADS